MDGFFQIIAQMVTLFSIIGVGYACKKIGVMKREFDTQLSRLILNVAIPGMIIGSVLDAEHLPPIENILFAFAISCVSFAVVMVLARIIVFALRIDDGYKGVFKFMLCFGNVGFIGFPVLQAIFGSEALIYGAIFNLPFNVLIFTVGIAFLLQDVESDKKIATTWRTFLTPAILSCVVAIILTLMGICNVPILGEAFSTLGSFTTPGALLIIGSSLANMPVGRLLGGPRLWIACASRLIVIPLIVWAIFHFFITDQLMLGAIVVLSGMPVATNGTMFCYLYGGNENTMAQGTFMTTVLSLLTIPVLVQFMNMIVL